MEHFFGAKVCVELGRKDEEEVTSTLKMATKAKINCGGEVPRFLKKHAPIFFIFQHTPVKASEKLMKDLGQEDIQNMFKLRAYRKAENQNQNAQPTAKAEAKSKPRTKKSKFVCKFGSIKQVQPFIQL